MRWDRDYSATRQICWAATISPMPLIAAKWPKCSRSTRQRFRRKTVGPTTEFWKAFSAAKSAALWIVCTNPAHSWINQGQARDILQRLDFLVVQDMYHNTETAQLAHLVLPAAGMGREGRDVHQFGTPIWTLSASVSALPARRSPIFESFNSSPNIGAAARCFASGNRPPTYFNC